MEFQTNRVNLGYLYSIPRQVFHVIAMSYTKLMVFVALLIFSTVLASDFVLMKETSSWTMMHSFVSTTFLGSGQKTVNQSEPKFFIDEFHIYVD